MKKISAVIVCLTLMFSFAACGKETQPAETQPAPSETQSAAVPEVTGETLPPATSEDYFILGTLVTVNGETPFVINGLRLDGNRSASENNGRPYAVQDIRSGFFLDERIAFYIDTPYSNPDSEDAKVLCLPHRPAEKYEGVSFEELAENAAFCETFTGQESDEYSCFDPYVFSEDFGEGYYDVLFTYRGEIVYLLVIYLTPEIQ